MPPRRPGVTTTPTRRRGPSSTPSCGGPRPATRTHAADLADRLSGLLEFGTAGLRGALGAGPNRMNRTVVIRAAAGLDGLPQGRGPRRRRAHVVIGYDARYNSDVFARDTAAVVVAARLAGRCCCPAAADAGARLRHPPPRRRRRRHGHREPQPAAGQRLQGLPRRRQPDRAARRRARSPPHIGRVERGRRRAARRGRLGDARRRPAARTTSTQSSTVVDPSSPRDLRDRPHEPARRRPRHGAHRAFVAGRLRGARRRRRAGRAGPATSRPSPSPTRRRRARSTSRWPAPAPSGADLVIANDPDADRCAAAVLDPAARRLADAARRRGRRPARGPPRPPRRLARRRLRQLHRVVAAARAIAEGRRASVTRRR